VWTTEYVQCGQLAPGEVRLLESSFWVSERSRARKGATLEVVAIACTSPVVQGLALVMPTLQKVGEEDSGVQDEHEPGTDEGADLSEPSGVGADGSQVDLTRPLWSLIDRYSSSGRLVDFYSEEWLTSDEVTGRLADVGWDASGSPQELGGFEAFIAEHGADCAHHLAAFCPAGPSDRLLRDLLKVHPPIKDSFNPEQHQPAVVLLNARTGQIVEVGLGRKGRLFARGYPGRTEIGIDAESAPYWTDLDTDNDPFIARFTERDPLDFVRFIVDAIVGFGLCSREYNLEYPGSPDELESLLADVPDDEAELECGAATMTRRSAAAAVERMRELLQTMEEKQRRFNAIFPDAEGLDPTDY
jgi:hypothetical protein